jgi:hypothetical protein
MAQHDYVIANGTGAAVRSDINGALAAIVSNNSGATEPTTTYAYMPWADTGSSPPVFKIRNAANNGWITLYELDGTFSVEAGSASSPGLYFTGDINTGIFSAGADQFNIATNGVERVEWGTSEVVFNDGGANYDFRIEGDTNSSLFFVDASAEAVGIGTASPSVLLHIEQTSPADGRLARIVSAGVGAGFLGVKSTGNTFIDANTSATALEFRTQDTERARIDSSGRLLVGTSTSALERVVILGDGGGIQINRNQTGSPTSGQALGSIGFKGIVSPNSNASAEVLIQAVAEENHSGSVAGSRLEFYTKANGTGPGSSPTERMRIDNSGAVLINRTTLGNIGDSFGTALGLNYAYFERSGSPAVYIRRGTSTGNAVEFYQGTNTFVGSISVTGSATAYNTSSDHRLKENIVPLTGAIDRINQLQVHRFNFIAEPDRTVDGFIAHEAQDVVPECVTGEKDAVDDDGNPIYQGIDQSKLVPLLTAALQEAIGRIESLEAEVSALKAS